MKKNIFSHVLLGAIFSIVLGFTHQAQAASIAVDSSVALTSSTPYHMTNASISDNSYMVVAAGEDGVLLYQATTDGIAATPTATINTPGTAIDVAVYGSTLYIADRFTTSGQFGLQTEGHVYIYNIATPSSPTLTATYAVPFADFQTVALSENGSTLYAGDRISGIHILNVTNPAAPTLLSTYEDGTATVNLTVSGTKLYLLQTVSDYGVVQVVDMTTPTAPAYLGGNDVNGTANELTLNENILYVSNGTTGLSIYDYSNPANPSLLGNYDSAGTASSFSLLNDDFGILADSSGGIVVASLANPVSPQIIATENTQITSAIDTVILNGKIYVLSNGIYELSLDLNFTVTGAAGGELETVTVTEGDATWCTISASDKELGSQAFIADLDGDGKNQEIVEAPKKKTKQPMVRVYSALSCDLIYEKKMSDSDSKLKFRIQAGNFYGDESSKDEVVATRAFEKDGVSKMQLLGYFLNTSNELKQKAKNSFESQKTFVDDGYTVALKEGKSYPIVLTAKSNSDIKEKYQLKKNDSEYKFKKKSE